MQIHDIQLSASDPGRSWRAWSGTKGKNLPKSPEGEDLLRHVGFKFTNRFIIPSTKTPICAKVRLTDIESVKLGKVGLSSELPQTSKPHATLQTVISSSLWHPSSPGGGALLTSFPFPCRPSFRRPFRLLSLFLSDPFPSPSRLSFHRLLLPTVGAGCSA